MKCKKNYFLKCLFVLFICVLFNSVSFATGSSTNYRIATEVIDSGGGTGASSSYNLLGKARELKLGIPASSSYIVHEGFIATAFPVLAVIVTGITPNFGYNTGIISITNLSGVNFRDGATVRLTRSGENDIIATNVKVLSSSQITCSIDLSGAASGAWNVVVTNPDSESGALADAFTVNTWAFQGRAINTPNPFNPLDGPTTIVYQLTEDANTALLIYNISHELIYRADFVAGNNGGRAGDNSIIWNGYSTFAELAANGIYFLRVADKRTGKVLVKGKIAVLK